jgi:hypothetical protein
MSLRNSQFLGGQQVSGALAEGVAHPLRMCTPQKVPSDISGSGTIDAFLPIPLAKDNEKYWTVVYNTHKETPKCGQKEGEWLAEDAEDDHWVSCFLHMSYWASC